MPRLLHRVLFLWARSHSGARRVQRSLKEQPNTVSWYLLIECSPCPKDANQHKASSWSFHSDRRGPRGLGQGLDLCSKNDEGSTDTLEQGGGNIMEKAPSTNYLSGCWKEKWQSQGCPCSVMPNFVKAKPLHKTKLRETPRVTRNKYEALVLAKTGVWNLNFRLLGFFLTLQPPKWWIG